MRVRVEHFYSALEDGMDTEELRNCRTASIIREVGDAVQNAIDGDTSPLDRIMRDCRRP